VASDDGFAIGLFERLAFALAVPVFLNNEGDALPAELGLSRVGGTSLGDLRVALRGRLLGDGGDGFGLVLDADATLPTASRADLSGDLGVTQSTRAVADWHQGGLRFTVNAGFRARKDVTLLDHTFGHEILFGGAASVPLLGRDLVAVGAIQGWTGTSDPFRNAVTTVADGLAGVQFRSGDLVLSAGAGGGVLNGFGSPAFRAVFGAAWLPPAPGEPGYRAPGSPPPFQCPGHPAITEPAHCQDGDGDTLLDQDDRCPQAKGPAALKGCPDSDADGVVDLDDRCPTATGAAALQGCPDTDNDGVADLDDRCPTATGLAANQGCPPDQDGDGVPDAADKCPDLPGKPERAGCPEERVVVTQAKIAITEKIFFESGDDRVDARSFGLLDEIAGILKKHTEIRAVRIEGHTDNVGDPAENKRLSGQRAAAVRKYLIGKGGVAAKRLQSEGFGDAKPIGDNTTEEGRAQNRRVEFAIVERQ
jgi:outer membrane protein OmpA-like peptidoglycan-associated protein